jgi:hypothetical protein
MTEGISERMKQYDTETVNEANGAAEQDQD